VARARTETGAGARFVFRRALACSPDETPSLMLNARVLNVELVAFRSSSSRNQRAAVRTREARFSISVPEPDRIRGS